MIKNKIINLDCTFRDGGYYNNWFFKKNNIDFYIKNISKTKIKYIEIGFRFFNSKNSGLTAYSNDKFINSLKINNDLKIGVMINATDFIIKNKLEINRLKEVFPKFNNLAFIRIAFHNKDLNNVAKITKFFSNKGPKIILNLMQISELNKIKIIKTLKVINKLNIDAFYIADSFGSLNPGYITYLSKILKRYCKLKLGFHAHDNLSLALKNAQKAIKENFTYIDSTILGMGRGAGNLRTEDIYPYLYKDDKIGIESLKKIKNKIFKPLKKKYKWGTDKYYKFAAKHSIHPSYVQELLNNKNYSRKKTIQILKSLSKIDSTKYNPENLNFYKKSNNNKNINEIKLKDDVLILGSSPKLKIFKNKIEKFCNKLNLSKIAVNLNSVLDSSMIDYRVASHPQRVQMDYMFYKRFNNPLIIPTNVINPKIVNFFRQKKINFFNYNLNVLRKKNISISQKECFLPNYLVLGYTLSLAASRNVKRIFLAGFEGFEKDSFINDESHIVLSLFKKKFKKIDIISITPTKFNIKYHKLF